MNDIEEYIEKSAQVHQFAAEVARIISGIPQMPEFSSESMSVSDASQLIGLPVTSIRAGIVYGWLPIGTAIQNNKPAKSLSGGRITYIISPRKVYEVTGHVWKGKAALNK
jgi:hypothetical protein